MPALLNIDYRCKHLGDQIAFAHFSFAVVRMPVMVMIVVIMGVAVLLKSTRTGFCLGMHAGFSSLNNNFDLCKAFWF